MIPIKSTLVKCGYYYNCCHVTGVNQTGVSIKLPDRFTRITAPAFWCCHFLRSDILLWIKHGGALHFRFAILLLRKKWDSNPREFYCSNLLSYPGEPGRGIEPLTRRVWLTWSIATIAYRWLLRLHCRACETLTWFVYSTGAYQSCRKASFCVDTSSTLIF